MQDQEAVLGDGFAHDGEIEVPFVEDRAGLGLLSGRSTMSMRSWLSDSIIS
jgi:hypothetical protein